ncbi:MAG: helix-turn-helix domain-containing protein [Elusimicrobia bacterium]|nr:helix-turn-helix domain-containing protein [Elusimicrobiota bacterium]
MKVGEKIEKLRKEKGLTKVELTKKLGLLNSSVISQWARGRINPSMDSKRRLAKEFGVPVAYFQDDHPCPSEILAQKHSVLYNSISGAEGAGGVRDAAAPYEPGRYPRAKHIPIRDVVRGSFFDLPFYSSDGYLPLLFENLDDKQPFAFKIGDDKVFSGASKGEYAIINPTEKVSDGKTALLKIDSKYCIRKVSFLKDGVILRDGAKHTKSKEMPEIYGLVVAFLRLP